MLLPTEKILQSSPKVAAWAETVRVTTVFFQHFTFSFSILQKFHTEKLAKSPMDIARCYGCGATKKAIEHRILGPIKQEVEIIKKSLTNTGQGPPELTQAGASKGSQGQSCNILPLPAHHVSILLFLVLGTNSKIQSMV
jgi:hypothetical protein